MILCISGGSLVALSAEETSKQSKRSITGLLKPVLLGRNREESVFSVCLLVLVITCIGFVVITGGDWADAISDREGAGKKPKLEHFMRAGWWWSALLGGGLAFVLWGSRKLWYFESQEIAVSKKRSDRSKWFLWVFLIIVAAAFVRWPRMELGLYNDEADVFVRYIGGSFKGAAWDLESETLPEYDQKTWATTFWGNKQGNNHVLFSVLARICFDLDRWITGSVPGEIHELPLRLPPLAGGLISILMVALLLRELGRSDAGILAAAFLAIHPWHLRFSTEARGYGLLFAMMLVAAFFLVRALKTQQWKWWMGYGLFQCLYLYSCLSGVYYAVAMNAAVGCFWVAGEWGRVGGLQKIKLWDWRTVKGLVVSNVTSLILFLFLLGPSIPQIARATKNIGIFKLGMPSGLWPNVVSYLAFGMPWFDGDPENKMNPAVEKWFPEFIMIAGIVVVLVLVAFGIRAWWKTGMAGRVMLAGAWISVLLVYGINSLNGGTVLTWYLVYLTPTAAMTFGLGLADLMRFRSKMGTGKVILRNRLLLYSIIGIYAFVVMKPIQRYRRIGKQAMRSAIERARRGEVYPFTKEGMEPITAGWWTNADIYDPYLKVAYQKQQIGYLMDKADREKRPFYFILGSYPSAKAEDASVVALLEDSGEFERVKVFFGLEEYQYREFVFAYRGNTGKMKAK